MSTTPTSTPTPTPTPSFGIDIFSFQLCCSPYSKFRINDIHGSLVIGQTFLIEGGTFSDAICAELIPYEDVGEIYHGSGVTFLEQDDCNDIDCPSCPPLEISESISLFSVTCTCLSYNITNSFDSDQLVYYTDCYDNNVSVNVEGFQTISICACEDSVVYGEGIFLTLTGECPPLSQTPQPTPSPTPTITVSPSTDWNTCDESFCFVTYDPELDLYNGTYTVSGSGLYNSRNVFEGDVIGIIYYDSTNLRWCLSDTIGGTCLFAGPTPSYSVCPDLWNVVFSTGVCNTTTSTTSPCDVFDFIAYFDCDVPLTPSPTPTNSPTSTPTPTPTPSVDICNSVTGDITINVFTTTTTTSPSPTTTTTTICYEPLYGDVTFTLVESIIVCPGENYQFTNCNTQEIFYVEPSNIFIGVELFTGYTYSLTLNGGNGCFTFDGTSTISPNASVASVSNFYESCQSCQDVTPVPSQSNTPTPTVTPTLTNTPTPTITNTPTVTPTLTNTPTNSPSPSSSQPIVEYFALIDGDYCCLDDGSFTNLLVRRINFPIQNGFTYYDGEGRCFTITNVVITTSTPGYLDITTNFADCASCRNNNLPYFLAGYCYDGRMLADSGSPPTNCLQVQGGLGSATRYRSNYPYEYLFTGQWQSVDMYIIDITTNCLLSSKPISDGCQYWETSSNGKVIAGYPQIGFDCSGAGGCCPGVAPSPG
jgi:hypothetical protein